MPKLHRDREPTYGPRDTEGPWPPDTDGGERSSPGNSSAVSTEKPESGADGKSSKTQSRAHTVVSHSDKDRTESYSVDSTAGDTTSASRRKG